MSVFTINKCSKYALSYFGLTLGIRFLEFSEHFIYNITVSFSLTIQITLEVLKEKNII